MLCGRAAGITIPLMDDVPLYQSPKSQHCSMQMLLGIPGILYKLRSISISVSICMYWEREREREKGLSSGSSSPKWMQQLVLSQADASNQEFHPSLPHGWQSPNTCVNLHCLLQALSREVDGKQSSQDVNQHPYGMPGVADSSLILCAANMGSLNANLNCSYFVSYPAPCSCFW